MAKAKRAALAATLAQRVGKSANKTLAREVAAYLLAERRTADLASLMRDVVEARAEQGVVEVTAVSAHALDTKVRADIEKQVKKVYPAAKSIIINEQITPNVVGGLRLEFPGQQLDMSVRAKLSKFKQLTTA